MKLVVKEISIAELNKMSEKMFGRLMKAVVDIEKEIMMVDSEMHSDEKEVMLELGSDQPNLWGINLYPEKSGEDFIEFDSMINVRPGWGNKSRGVDDPKTKEKIIEIVNKLVKKC